MAGPDIRNIDALPAPIQSAETGAPETDTKNLDPLLASLNTSAERFQTLWFSFLGLTLYFAIAALTTTHRDLLLGEPQTLPILNIKVPLLPFYVIAPLLYWIFHFYLLMMLTLLTRTAAEFEEQLRTTLRDETDRERYRARVENTLFLQLFVGMKGERSGINALLLAMIATITIVLAPLTTMVLMQMRFLPYHHFRITWVHRVFVLADVFLIVIMTSPIIYARCVRKAPRMAGAPCHRPRWLTVATIYTLVTLSLLPLSCWLSFKEGRWAGEPWPSFQQWRWWAREPLPFEIGNPDYEATKNGVVFGLFPDRLILWNEIVVGEARLEDIKKEITSRNGDFIPTTELKYRDLQAARLDNADLRGVSLSEAAMQGAILTYARLDGAALDNASLRGAMLRNAQLQGASLSSAQLQGADLGGAHLEGAYLFSAQLQGADLSGAHLQGAYLQQAQLQGADLGRAQLQGTDLSYAQLQGADLTAAQLQGAALRFAQLQGASLDRAILDDSELKGTFVFRTDIVDANLSASAIESVTARNAKPADNPDQGTDGPSTSDYLEPLTPNAVEKWSSAATEFAPRSRRGPTIGRFARLEPDFQSAEEDEDDMATWSAAASVQHDLLGPPHLRRLANILGNLACTADGAPYLARALVDTRYYSITSSAYVSRLSALGDQLNTVRDRMKDSRKNPEACPGAAGFTESDWRLLDAIKPMPETTRAAR